MATESDSPVYLFAAGAADEHRRLATQARMFEPFTERLFRQAGLSPGMRVLDLGSGAGDVSLLASRLVGPTGSVVGLELSSDAVDRAQRRVRETGVDNVTFVVGDANDLPGLPALEGLRFDAVVGRLILIYLADPRTVLAAAAQRLRPGGLICFQEFDSDYVWATPPSPLWNQIHDWGMEIMARAGIDPRMGLKLHEIFRSAGLSVPQLLIDGLGGQEPEGALTFWVNAITAGIPVMEKLGVATRAEVDPGTLADRLLAETIAYDGTIVTPLLIGAWARTPTDESTPTRLPTREVQDEPDPR